MKVKAIAPWFGGKRTMATSIVAELGPHTQYFEPFCGSMAVLFAKEPSQKETVNDLHGDLINLARVLADREAAEELYDRLSRTLFSEGLLDESRAYLAMEVNALPDLWGIYAQHTERAYWYFLASWMGRNGTAGTARQDYQLAVRWTKNGGSPTVRWRNAVDSIPAWHERLRNVVILQRDAFSIIDRFEDVKETVIYADPPYYRKTRSKDGKGGQYEHEFKHDDDLLGPGDHRRLAEALNEYEHARVVVSYYDHPWIRELYAGWTVVEHTRIKHLHAQNGRGSRGKEAPEILLINGPSYVESPGLF